jgi:hypothetical protein
MLGVFIVAIPVFLALAWWNGAVAVLFGIAVLTYVLSTLYWKYSADDPFAGAIDRRDADLYGDSRARPPSPRKRD